MSSSVGRPVAVVGGFGFVGTHVVAELRRRGIPKENIRIVDRFVITTSGENASNACKCDLTSVDDCVAALSGCGTVINCAGLVDTRAHRQRIFAVNFTGVCNLVEACKKVGVSILIHISSHSARSDGTWGDDLGAVEGEGKASVYGASKRAAEMYVRQAHSASLSTLSIRPQTVFGPGDALWTETVLFGTMAPPRIGSDAKVTTPIYVKNLAHLIIEAALRLEIPVGATSSSSCSSSTTSSSASSCSSCSSSSASSPSSEPLQGRHLVGGGILDAGDAHVPICDLRGLLLSCRAAPPSVSSVRLPLWVAWILACAFELLDFVLCLLLTEPRNWRCLKLTRSALYYVDGANFRFRKDAYERVGMGAPPYSFPDGIREDLRAWVLEQSEDPKRK